MAGSRPYPQSSLLIACQSPAAGQRPTGLVLTRGPSIDTFIIVALTATEEWVVCLRITMRRHFPRPPARPADNGDTDTYHGRHVTRLSPATSVSVSHVRAWPVFTKGDIRFGKPYTHLISKHNQHVFVKTILRSNQQWSAISEYLYVETVRKRTTSFQTVARWLTVQNTPYWKSARARKCKSYFDMEVDRRVICELDLQETPSVHYLHHLLTWRHRPISVYGNCTVDILTS